MTTDSEGTIATHAKICFQSFEQLCALVKRRSYIASDRLSLSDVLDELGRFRIWAGNIGALEHGSASLDYRLREAAHVRRQVVQFLKDLGVTLKEVKSIVSGERPQRQLDPSSALLDFDFSNEESFTDSDDDSEFDLELSDNSSSEHRPEEITELHELFLALAEAITSLLKLSIAIRNPAPLDRYAKSALLSPMDETYDTGHVWEKFPHVRDKPWLISRLGKANTRRRQYFSYRERHREKLSRAIRPSEHKATVAIHDDSSQAEMAGPLENRSHQELQSYLSSTAPSNSFVLSGSANIALDDLDKLDEVSNAGLSETSFATSVSESSEGVLYPPPLPKAATSGAPFECPYCFTIQTVRSTRDWKRHVFNDLNPYVCTWEDCASKPFPTRHEWFNHELEAHRKQWRCKAKSCSSTFTTIASFWNHLNTKHPGSFTEAQLNALFDISGEPVDKILPLECPLCTTWSAHLSQLMSQSNVQISYDALAVTPKQFRNHLGRHLEQLALFALPRQYDDDEDIDQVDSNKPAADTYSENPPIDQIMQAVGFKDSKNVVMLPLERGANIRYSKEDLGLYRAAKEGRDTLLKLINKGVDISSVGSDGATAVHQAARNGDEQVVQLLHQMGADIDIKDSSGSTALHSAADKGHESIIKLLLELGADIDARDLSGATSLHRAAGKGQDEVVRLLLEKQATIDQKDFAGSTPLHRAARKGHHSTAHLLLLSGAHVDEKDNDGLTPLALAVHREDYEKIVNLLLSSGADIETKGVKGVTPLQAVAGKGRVKVARHLIAAQANVDAPGPRRMTSLHRATYNNFEDMVRELLECGATVDLTDDDGWTALHGAASAGFEAVGRLLITGGADLERCDNVGLRALHHAAGAGRAAFVQLLLKSGADITAMTRLGETALQLAIRKGHSTIVEMLKDKA